MTAEQEVNIVTVCLNNLIETGAEVIGITFDGVAANLTMVKLLGSDIRDMSSRGYFQLEGYHEKCILHPDTYHMIKLVRYAWEYFRIFIDPEGRLISWEYFEQLLELQQKEGLHLGNKLSKAHVYFQKQKKKVRLATQTLSRSVADALDFCREVLAMPQFAESEAVSNFIGIINDALDILNSRRSSEVKYLKKAVCHENIEFIFNFSRTAIEYIKEL